MSHPFLLSRLHSYTFLQTWHQPSLTTRSRWSNACTGRPCVGWLWDADTAILFSLPATWRAPLHVPTQEWFRSDDSVCATAAKRGWASQPSRAPDVAALGFILPPTYSPRRRIDRCKLASLEGVARGQQAAVGSKHAEPNWARWRWGDAAGGKSHANRRRCTFEAWL